MGKLTLPRASASVMYSLPDDNRGGESTKDQLEVALVEYFSKLFNSLPRLSRAMVASGSRS